MGNNLDNEIEQAKDDANTFKNEAKQAKDDANTFKNEAEQAKNDANTFKNETEKEINELKKNINNLLKEATGKSLANSYNKSSKSHSWSYWIFTFLFVISIVGIIISGYFNLDTIKEINTKNIDSQNYKYLLFLFIKMLPFYTSFIWLATFSSKKINENKRLQEEYNHKKNMVVLYEGFRKKEEKEENYTESQKIMENIIKMSAENPSSTLEKNHMEHSPMIEILNKLLKENPEKFHEIIAWFNKKNK